MITKRFKAKEHSFTQKEAQVYGECLSELAERNNGSIKTTDVVDEARSPDSPLHDYFDWDDSQAAEKYRRVQARHLIRNIIVEIKYDHQVKESRAFINVNLTPDGDDEGSKNREYATAIKVFSSATLTKQVIMKALRELEYWKSQYSQYKELELAFKAIEVPVRRIKRKYHIK